MHLSPLFRAIKHILSYRLQSDLDIGKIPRVSKILTFLKRSRYFAA